MIAAAKAFTDYLDGRNVKYKTFDENTLTVTYVGENAPEIEVMFIFGNENHDVAVRCWSVAKVPPEKLTKAYELCSKLNNKWRWMKFCVDSDDEITAQNDAIINLSTAGAECFELLARCVDIVDRSYPEIMAMIWGFNTGVSAPQKK